MLPPVTAAIAANRFGLGARPGDLAAIGGDGREWLRTQLRGAPPLLQSTELRGSQQILAEALELRRDMQQERKADAFDRQTGTPEMCCRNTCGPSTPPR